METGRALQNQVAKYRQFANWSQAFVADRIGVTRQTVRLIESGKMIPSTLVALRLAQLFHVSVEDLFAEDTVSSEQLVDVWPDDAVVQGHRVVVADIGGRRIVRRAVGPEVYPIPAAPYVGTLKHSVDKNKGIVSGGMGPGPEPSFLLAGCDLGLGLLSSHLSKPAGRAAVNAVWLATDNERARRQLFAHAVHVAAVHVADDAATDGGDERASGSGERYHSRVSDDGAFGPLEVMRIQFARWQVGWLVQPGNPQGFGGVEDLAHQRLRLVNRPKGSGVRKLLDHLLAEAGISQNEVSQYEFCVGGHRQVAEAIASGLAHVGIGSETAAAMLGLDFLPLRTERSELWIPLSQRDHPMTDRLMQVLHSDTFRKDLESYGPCDVQKMGWRLEK
ncbi:MAG: helix-turn-helix domain-containing protein [Alicyclobacillaceae bacterium]|nr:helix-turn-helix domain-containing protein [Alicyclobacillaceae bacterium]